MNPLGLEQMMVSSSASRSIAHATGSIFSNTHICSNRFIRRKPHRLRKETEVPILRTRRDVPGIPLLRFRGKIAVHETRLFFRDRVPATFFQDHTNQLLRNGDVHGRYDRRFLFPYGNQQIVFYQGLEARSYTICILRGAQILVSFRVPEPFCNHRMTDLTRNALLVALSSKEYILQPTRLRSIQYVAS